MDPAEFLLPNPTPITKVSPSLANELLECERRVAFRQDPALRSWRRPSTYSVLGEIAHAIAESVRARGNWPTDPTSLEVEVEACWDQETSRGYAKLAEAWKPAQPPSPDTWPGYQLTRARTLRRTVKLLAGRQARRQDDTSGVRVQAATEVELADPETGLFGRADRIEQSGRGTRIVDLKTGLRQGEPTDAQRRQLLLYAVLLQHTTGTWPREVVIENASGQQTKLPLDPDEAVASLAEVTTAVSQFNAHLERGAQHTTTNASPDVCRWCPYRVLCEDYWTHLTSSWQHHDVLGSILESGATSHGAYAHVEIESPTDLRGRRINVSALPQAPPGDAHGIAVVDLKTHVDAADTQARWNSLVRTW
jgi:RecB family exonuclease